MLQDYNDDSRILEDGYPRKGTLLILILLHFLTLFMFKIFFKSKLIFTNCFITSGFYFTDERTK